MLNNKGNQRSRVDSKAKSNGLAVLSSPGAYKAEEYRIDRILNNGAGEGAATVVAAGAVVATTVGAARAAVFPMTITPGAVVTAVKVGEVKIIVAFGKR